MTPEDVLRPEEGDRVTHNEAHQRRLGYLYDVLRAQLAAAVGAVVLSDVRIAWDIPGLKAHGPDIAVILGVREQKSWSTFDVAEEGVRPVLIVEFTSSETRGLDLVNKLDEYDDAQVPLYVIVDGFSRRGQRGLRLLGYQLTALGYEAMRPDASGRLWLEPVKIWLGIEAGEIICYDEHDAMLGDYTVLVAAQREAEARAEAAARSAAEARLLALEAELRRLRGE